MDHIVARLANVTDKPLGRGRRSLSSVLGGWIKHNAILGVTPSVADRLSADICTLLSRLIAGPKIARAFCTEPATHVREGVRGNVTTNSFVSITDVRWSGECSTSADVLDWYGRFLADGTRATVESVEIDRDAVVMGIRVAGQAEGARPAPAERVFQVFTVDHDEIVEIRGFPDRSSALARP